MNDPVRHLTDADLDIDGKTVMCVDQLYAPYCGICRRGFREALSPDEQRVYQWAYEHVLLHKAGLIA